MYAKTSASSAVGAYTYVQRASAVHGLVHCADGNIKFFTDHFSRNLASAVNMASKMLGGNAPLHVDLHRRHSDYEPEAILKSMREFERLSRYKDLAFVPAVEWLVEHLPHDKVLAMQYELDARRSYVWKDVDALLADLYEDSQAARSVELSIVWQKEAEENWQRIKACVEGGLSTQTPLIAIKVDLLHQAFAPSNQEHAAELYGHFIDGQIPTQPGVAQVQSNQRAFHTALLNALPEKKLCAWVYITSYAHISGPYTTAVLLFDGEGNDMPETLVSVVQKCWATVTEDEGFGYAWPPDKCAWVGPITPDDKQKRSALLLGLECVSLAEQFVRPRCLLDQSTFEVGSIPELSKEYEYEHA